MKQTFLIFCTILFSIPSFSQTQLYGPTISYQSQSGNMAKIGGFYLHNSESNFTYKIDATANLAYFRGKFRAIPEIGFTFYPKPDYLISPTLEAEVSPYTITPKIGFSILTMVDFSFGYGIETNTKTNLKPIRGFTFTFGLNIPINAF